MGVILARGITWTSLTVGVYSRIFLLASFPWFLYRIVLLPELAAVHGDIHYMMLNVVWH